MKKKPTAKKSGKSNLPTDLDQLQEELNRLKEENSLLTKQNLSHQKEVAVLLKLHDENPNPVIKLDLGGKIIYANPASKKILTFFSENDPQQTIWKEIAADAKTKKDKELTLPNEIISLSIVPQISNGLICIYGRDVTNLRSAQAQIKREEQKYKAIIENANDIFYSINAQGIFVYVNEIACRITGYSQTELLNTHFTDLIRVDHREKVAEIYRQQAYSKLKSTYLEFPIITKKGEEIWIGQNVQLNNVTDPSNLFTAIARDITERYLTDVKLSMTSSRLIALIGNMQTGVIVEDENRKLVLVNQVFCDLFGINNNPDDLIGADCAAYAEFSKEMFRDPENFISRITQVLKDNQYVSQDELELKDGRIFNRDYVPIISNDKYLGNLWLYSDVTEKKQEEQALQRNEEKYRNIIENMNLGLMEVDMNDNILYANKRFYELTGYDKHQQELVGKKAMATFLDQEEFEKMKKQQEDRKIGKSGAYEVRMKKKGGEEIWAMVSGAPLLDKKNKIIGSIGIHLDITDNKRTEIELVDAKGKAEASAKAKEQFLANMSHEIRTPMNAILGLTEILWEEDVSLHSKKYLEAIKFSANNLLTIINEVLDFSKIEAGKMQLSSAPFSLKDLIIKIISSLTYAAEDKGILLDYSIQKGIPDSLMGDATRIGQIIINLVTNSIKFTEMGQVSLDCNIQHELTEEKVLIELRITDTGIGIDENMLSKVFESFSQENEQTAIRYGGTGLGLTISKQLVELMGGSIVVESRKDFGSTFTVRIPLQKTNEPPATSRREKINAQKKTLKGIHILLAEDNEINQMLAKAILEQWDANVDVASTGTQAIELFSSKHHDIILMDIQMPDLTGVEASYYIRQKLHSKVPIIAFTANAIAGEKEKYLNMGMDDYLSKPFDKNDLYHKIKALTAGKIVPTNLTGGSANPAYTLESLKEIANGDIAFVNTMLSIFIAESEKSIHQLELDLEKGNFKEIAGICHKLKSSVKIFNLKPLAEQLVDLEHKALLAVSVAEIQTLLEQVTYQLKQVSQEMKRDLILSKK